MHNKKLSALHLKTTKSKPEELSYAFETAVTPQFYLHMLGLKITFLKQNLKQYEYSILAIKVNIIFKLKVLRTLAFSKRKYPLRFFKCIICYQALLHYWKV